MSEPKKGIVCKYCEMVDCTMHSDISETQDSVATTNVMTHPGIPLPMSIGGVLSIIILSHFIFLRKANKVSKSYFQFNLLSIPLLKALVKKSYFPLLIQSLSIICFAVVIVCGLWGNPRGNIATYLTWGIWWALLIFIILVGGSLFCSVCPWEGLSSMITSLSFTSRKKKIGTNAKLKAKFRNIYIAIGFFILLTWLELGQDITFSPKLTALIGFGYFLIAVICAVYFERRVFCRYFCFVGRIQGIYSLFSPLEIRHINTDTCKSCKTMDCYKGNEKAEGCPTYIFPKTMTENTNCTLCTECIRSCPHDNLTINLRGLGIDLARKTSVRLDEAILCVVLLALTSFHGLTMTPIWTNMVNKIRVFFQITETPVFTFLMFVFILLPLGMFLFFSWVAKKLTKARATTKELFKVFSYSVLPIALFYHLAHNGMHFFMEAQNILPVLSDPFGWGWDLFGTAGNRYNPLLTLKTIWWLQLILIVVGHLFSVYISDITTRRLYQDSKLYKRAIMPFMVLMILYSTFSIWLISLPMEMKSGM